MVLLKPKEKESEVLSLSIRAGSMGSKGKKRTISKYKKRKKQNN